MKETMPLGKFRGLKVGTYDILVVFHIQNIDDDPYLIEEPSALFWF